MNTKQRIKQRTKPRRALDLNAEATFAQTRAFARRGGEVDAPRDEPLSRETKIDRTFERAISQGRGVELLHAVEKVRRLCGGDATIGVVIFAKDRAIYDSVNFCEQREEIDDKCGLFKVIDVGRCHIQLGHHTRANGTASVTIH